LIKRKISPNKALGDVQESINHSKVFLKVINEKRDLSLSLLLEWHKELFQETKQDIAGRLRDYSVSVGNYRAPDWQDLKKLLTDFFNFYKKNKRIFHPVELAARLHYKFEKIHPFGDGNGRIGRLIIAYILMKCGYPLLVISYKKRRSYYHALEKDENKFFQYFITRYISTFKSH
jgi:Fic family protein